MSVRQMLSTLVAAFAALLAAWSYRSHEPPTAPAPRTNPLSVIVEAPEVPALVRGSAGTAVSPSADSKITAAPEHLPGFGPSVSASLGGPGEPVCAKLGTGAVSEPSADTDDDARSSGGALDCASTASGECRDEAPLRPTSDTDENSARCRTPGAGAQPSLPSNRPVTPTARETSAPSAAGLSAPPCTSLGASTGPPGAVDTASADHVREG